MNIGLSLANARIEKGLSQKELAAKLREKGIAVTNQAVSKWETGTTQPSAVQLLAVCEVLEIENFRDTFGLSRTDGLLSGLNRYGREMVIEYITLLKNSEKYRSECLERSFRRLPLYTIPASAGNGQFLDSDNYDMVEVDESVPMEANFGVRLSGNSMEPYYHDKDVVWIKQEKTLNHGDIGLFFYCGNVYCKRFDLSSEMIRLCSLNPAYKPIEVDESYDFHVFGKVIANFTYDED